MLKLVWDRHPNGTYWQKSLASFIPSPPSPQLPMRDVLLKHLTLFPCQKDKNGASVRSCAILEADAFLCLAVQGREGQRGEIRGSQESRCNDLCKTLWNAHSAGGYPWAWGRECVPRLDTRKQEFAHFTWQITSGKSLAGARAWVLSSLLEFQKLCRIKCATAETISTN